MLENLKKISSTKFKRTNFKAFSFFLLFSFLIWVLVQFSKKYEETIRFSVAYTQVPKDKIITKEPVYLNLKIKENGFKIAWVSLFKKKLNIDLTELEANGKELVYNIENNTQNIRQQLGLSVEDVVFLDKYLRVNYQQKTVKIVPVISQVSVDFNPGFSTNDFLKISPDSIKISGPKGIIDEINALKTVPFKLKNVDSDVTGTVAIDTFGIGKITLYKRNVDYNLTVEKFTEGKVEVPINVINAPEEMDIAIFPKTVNVIFKVSLENFKEITKSDFRVICDYNDLEEGQGFFIPKVVKSPKMVTNLRLNINKVQFVIKK